MMPPKKKKAPAGLKRQHTDSVYSVLPDTSNELKNGHVLKIYFDNKSSVAGTLDKLCIRYELVPDIISKVGLRNHIRRVAEKSSKFKKLTAEREQNNFKEFCSLELFSHQPTPRRTKDADDSSTGETSATAEAKIEAPKQQKSLRERWRAAVDAKAEIKEKYSNRISKLNERLSRKNSVSLLNRKIDRRNKTILKMKHDFSETEAGKNLKSAKKEVKKLKRKITCLETERSECSDIKKLRLELSSKNDIIDQLENQLDSVNIEPDSEFHRETKNKKIGDKTRLFVYDCLVNQVPTNNIPNMLKLSARRFGVLLQDSDIPHRTGVELMARELGVISDLQCVDTILKNENLTLGFDATTQEGVHINSVHVTFANSPCKVIAIDQLAGGLAIDYQDHIVSSFDKLAKLYSTCNSLDYYETRKLILSKIANTMTDRVNVNHATIVLVNQAWQKSLTELNCHLHPLDTIASSVRAVLKKEQNIEKSEKKLFGSDCMAGDVVLQMNKMRFVDAKGDPSGFKVALLDNGLPLGFIPRYRGNRLHIFFNLCGKYFAHHHFFKTYLESGTECGGLRSSLKTDFSNPVTVTEFHVCGILGKLLTGPWMQQFYTSSETEINHLEGIQIIKNVISEIETQKKDLNTILNRSTDFFGNKLVADITLDNNSENRELQRKNTVLTALLLEPSDKELFNLFMDKCLEEIVTVLNRQYARYFDIDVTPELILQTESARSHNIDAEEVMGMFSAAQKKAPNATMAYLSSKLRAQKNKTNEYLDALDTNDRSRIINFAVSAARKVNIQCRRKTKDLKKEISLRKGKKTQKRHMTDRRKLEKKLRSTEIEEIAQEYEFDPQQIIELRDIVSGSAVGRDIGHYWHDESTNMRVFYHGKIEKIRKKRSGELKDIYVVCYWREDETYDADGTDYDMNRYELAVDLVLGDLVLL